jgi:hypothetical protein
MRRLPLLLGLALASPILAGPILAGPARAGDLALRRVMLSTGGVGYFEYEAAVDGPATLGLDVPLAQVDDVLKSLVVFDDAGGVGGLELPGEDAGHAAFGDVPFGPQALGSPLDYLNALQGVVLEVKGPRPMTGRLLRAEAVQEPAPPPNTPPSGVSRTRVTLLTSAGIQQFVLEEAESVQVADPGLRGRIERALEAARGEAAHDSRHLSLRSAGAGHRTVRVAYVAGAPLWKATYRLVLPAKDGDKARLQGWAVLENLSVSDWNGVELSLQYGNPVTFRQALYRSYFVQRPEVPVEVLGRILPAEDTRETDMALAAPPPQAPLPAAAPSMRTMAMAKSAPGGVADAVNAEAAMAEPEEQAATQEAAEATVFTLPTPVVLPAGHSAAVPILDREVPAERIGVVQPTRPHPLAALRIVNDTRASLPAGVLTMYDPLEAATYAGDARLGGLPDGETRLLEFAEDLRTVVDWHADGATTLVGVTATHGVLHIQRRERFSDRIAITAPAAEPRKLLVEIPKRAGGTLTVEGDAKSTSETATAWRVPLALKAGERRVLLAHVDRPLREDVALLDNPAILATILNEQALTPDARAALAHIADLRAALAGHESEREKLKQQVAELERDEDRLRRNIAAVPANDALHGKLVHALDADEDRMANLTAAAAQADAAIAQARTALEQAVTALKLG